MNRMLELFIAGSFASIATAQAPRTRDSAGVRIVENGPRLTAPAAFQLGDKPSFDVGGLQTDPADEFNTRNYYLKAARLSDGRVVVIDRTRVHFFDASGKRLKVVGREGSGPGEYRQSTDVCVTRGDTVLIGQTRGLITRLAGNGELVDAVPPPTGSYPEGQFCFGDGTYASLQRGAFQAGSPTPYRVLRNSFANPSLNTVAEFAYPAFDMLISSEVGQAAQGDRYYLAHPTTFDIAVYGAEGKLATIIRTADPLVEITSAERDKLSPTAYRAGSTPAEIEQARKDAIAKSKTKHWPTLRRLMVEPGGRIWVAEWAPRFEPTKPMTWAAFDRDGKLLGRLVIPGSPSNEERREVMGFGTNEIFFKRYDADGALHMTIVPIVPARR